MLVRRTIGLTAAEGVHDQTDPPRFTWYVYPRTARGHLGGLSCSAGLSQQIECLRVSSVILKTCKETLLDAGSTKADPAVTR